MLVIIMADRHACSIRALYFMCRSRSILMLQACLSAIIMKYLIWHGHW